MRKSALLCAAALFAAPTAAYAQSITSSVEGAVLDESGAAVAGASVTITDTRTGASRTITANADGRFSAVGLTVGGPYTITATADGYQGQTVEGVNTTLAGATSLSFNLTAATAAADATTIVVTGQRANVQLRAIGPGTAFGSAVLDSAPSFNRDIRDVIRLDPRVSLDRDDTGSGQDRISCLGGNDRGNAFTVDGIGQGDVYGLNDTGFASRSSTPIPYEAVRETQVQFAPFDTEYSGFTGCAINVVTRGGTNDFHGSGFYERSNNRLRGNSVAGRAVAGIQPDTRYGGSLGGPIIPDRLFFFGAYEHQEAGQSQDDGPTGGGYANPQTGISVAQFNAISDVLRTVYNINTGPLVTSRPFINDRYFGRLDWQITDRHRLEATYQRLEEATTRADDLFTGNSPQAVGLNTFYLSGTVSNYYSGRLYSNWTDNFSTELRYSRSEVIDRQDPIGGGEAQTANPIPRIIVGIDNPTGIDGAVLAGPGTSRSANDLRTTIEQYRALANLTVANHRLKLGFELNRADIFNLFVQNATGTLVFRNISDLQQGLLSPGLGNNNTTTTPVNIIGGQTEGAFGNFTADGNINSAAAAFRRDIWSVYFQDDWQVTDQLSVVLGVRTDWYDGGHPEANPNFFRRYGFANSTGFSNLDPIVMPRFGVTYDFDSGLFSHAQLRGGVGIFSGGDPGVWFGNAFQNDGSTFALGTTQTAGCPTGQIDVTPNGGAFTGVPTCMRAAAQATAAAGLGNTQAIDPDIKTPSVFRANIGFATDLALGGGILSGWHLNLDYIYSRYQNPFTLVDLSQTPDIRRGVAGFTTDGRPLYGAIDPTVAGCTAQLVSRDPQPVWSNVSAACFATTRGAELMLTNADGYESQIASLILSRYWRQGIFTPGGSVNLTLGYAYTDSHDRRSMYNSTAGSNYNQSAAFNRQNPDESRSFYESRHNITVNATFREEFIPDLATTFGISFIARSGRPYSLTFTGNALNSTNGGLTTNDNALLYIPTGVSDPNISPSSNAAAVQSLVDFTNGLNCAQGYQGRTIARNTCVSDWYLDVDLSLSQEIPGPLRWIGRGHDSIRFYATMDNFLNFLGDSLNIQRRIGNFFGVEDVASTTVDAQGRYIISAFNVPGGNINNDVLLNTSSSVWRLKVGLSYRF